MARKLSAARITRRTELSHLRLADKLLHRKRGRAQSSKMPVSDPLQGLHLNWTSAYAREN